MNNAQLDTFIDDAVANYDSFNLGAPGNEVIVHREISTERAAIIIECSAMNDGFVLTGTWKDIIGFVTTLRDAVAYLEER